MKQCIYNVCPASFRNTLSEYLEKERENMITVNAITETDQIAIGYMHFILHPSVDLKMYPRVLSFADI
jgi:hypothetical protein